MKSLSYSWKSGLGNIHQCQVQCNQRFLSKHCSHGFSRYSISFLLVLTFTIYYSLFPPLETWSTFKIIMMLIIMRMYKEGVLLGWSEALWRNKRNNTNTPQIVRPPTRAVNETSRSFHNIRRRPLLLASG